MIMRASGTRRSSWLAAPALLLPLLCSLHTGATTVYKTVDENGVVSFSDTLPDSGTDVETMNIEVSDPQPSAAERERLEQMRETTDRMAADRMAREKHRAEMRQLNRQQAQEAESYPEFYEPTTIYTGYSGYSRSRRHWGGGRYRPRPEHPIARPPLRPVPGHGYRPGIRRPVYNQYPASRVRQGYDPRVRTVIETGHYPSRPAPRKR